MMNDDENKTKDDKEESNMSRLAWLRYFAPVMTQAQKDQHYKALKEKQAKRKPFKPRMGPGSK